MTTIAPLLLEQAQAVVANYPPSRNDVPSADVDAALSAILGESERPDGCGWAEIAEAARAFAATMPKDPPWCRSWLRSRLYLPWVLEHRQRPAPAPRLTPAAWLAAEAEARAAAAKRAVEVAAVLDPLPDADLEAARSLLALEQESDLAARAIRRAPLRRGPVAGLIADRLSRDRAAWVPPEGGAAPRSGEPRDSSVHTTSISGDCRRRGVADG